MLILKILFSCLNQKFKALFHSIFNNVFMRSNILPHWAWGKRDWDGIIFVSVLFTVPVLTPKSSHLIQKLAVFLVGFFAYPQSEVFAVIWKCVSTVNSHQYFSSAGPPLHLHLIYPTISRRKSFRYSRERRERQE